MIYSFLTYWLDDLINASHRTSQNCDCGSVICSLRRAWPTRSAS